MNGLRLFRGTNGASRLLSFRQKFGQSEQQFTADRCYYNGKERQTVGSTGLLDYGARFYNPDIARWLIQDQDPLAEKYYGVSLYACCLNNPVRQVGSDGGGIFNPRYILRLQG